MAMKLYSDSDISDIADAIRSKNGSSDTYKVSQMASAIQNISNSYSASDEGKVVSNGALVAQTSDTVTANDTYDTTLINSLTVNVSGGGGISVDDIATNTAPSGVVTLGSSVTSIGDYALAGKPITSVIAPSVTSIATNALQGTQITDIDDTNFPSLGVTAQYVMLFRINSLKHLKLSGRRLAISSGSGALRDMANLLSVELPHCAENVGNSYKGMGASCFNGDKKLELVDIGICNSIGNMGFYNCNALTTLIMRNTSLVSLHNAATLANGTPFKSGGTGGHIYIPKVLYDQLGTGTNDYKSATNWSTVDGYGTITWHQIEGSIYEL